MLRKYWGHFCTVNKHRWLVFKLCCRVGIPWRGFVHDLSKYSPTEFIESAKFYQGGKRSPIPVARTEKGYSKAWLHHRGRNKHHVEYWTDLEALDKFPIIPYKYTIEMICDSIAASMVYNGKEWSADKQIKYWENKRKIVPMNDKIYDLSIEVFNQIRVNGIKQTMTRDNMKKLYSKYCS